MDNQNPHLEAKSLTGGFRSICKLLGNMDDWERNPWVKGGVRHKVYDIWFYAEHGGVRFRNAEGETLFEGNIIQCLVMIFRTLGYSRHFKPEPEMIHMREVYHG